MAAPVEPAADSRYGPRVVLVQRPVGKNGLDSLGEQLHGREAQKIIRACGVGRREWQGKERVFVLSL